MTDPVCEVGQPYRSACQAQTWYAEYEGKRYCVLHYPNEEKAAHPDRPFQQAVTRKLEGGDFNFAGVCFPEYLEDFASLVFDKEANFSNATFEGGVDFSNATFESQANFQRATFHITLGKAAKFEGATFCGGALFSTAKFRYKDGPKRRATHSGRTGVNPYRVATADFSHTTFKDWADFSSGTVFEGGARFDGAIFEKKAEFYQSVFKKTALFALPRIISRTKDPVTFEGPVKFYRSDLENAYFDEATFAKDADFAYTNLKDAVFRNATFNGYTKFTGATLTAPVRKTDFRRATFNGEVYFKEAKFSGYTDFYRTRFMDVVRFVGREGAVGQKPDKVFDLEGQVSFTRARIEKPKQFSFDTVELRPSWLCGVDAREFKFTRVEWFGLPNGPEGTLDDEISLLQEREGVKSPHTLLAQTCRELSINAEQNRDYRLSGEFHYWSMDALRKQSWSAFKCLRLQALRDSWRNIRKRFDLIATSYWALSGYGERPRRAFWVLVAIWLAFAVLYFLAVESSPFLVSSASDIWQGIDYARQAAVYSLSALVRLNPRPQSEGLDWFQTLVIIEGILGPLQIGLLLLAIRRRVMR
jgi:uncharacterized protein YjbI with pentapeptide repeats